MKVIYFDCFSGISGDMTMAALLDLGIDQSRFREEMQKLNLHGYEIEINKKVQSGITGTDVNVKLHDSGHHHHHHHSHHEHDHESRNLEDITGLIEASDICLNAKTLSINIFTEIAKAEAKVHGKGINEVHFHEVGAVDSIVDIVGCAVCLELLGVERVYSSPLHDGKGFITCQHGKIPVPVPAVMKMLEGSRIPLITEDIETELITPTGMGFIKTVAQSFGNMPAIIVDRIGYGMGKRNTGRLNALRVVLGELYGEKDILEEISVIETNIDDMTPEMLGYTMERLIKSGVLDVFCTPIYMKKNRPGVKMTVLAKKENEKRISEIILKETSTLGVRCSISKRYCMDREFTEVNTRYGKVTFKIAQNDKCVKAAPEYEDLRKIAVDNNMPITMVYDHVKEDYARSGQRNTV